MKIEFSGQIIVVLLYFKSQGTQNNNLFSQRTHNFQNLRNKTMAVADHEYVKNFQACFVPYKVTARRRQRIVYLE